MPNLNGYHFGSCEDVYAAFKLLAPLTRHSSPSRGLPTSGSRSSPSTGPRASEIVKWYTYLEYYYDPQQSDSESPER